MSILIDLILVAIFLTLLVVFTKNGFAKTVHQIGKVWLSLFCSIGLGPLISKPIHAWFLGSAFTGGIKNTLTTLVETNPNGYSLSELFRNLPTGLVRFLESYQISLPELEAEYGSASVVNEGLLQALAERIADPCASAVSALLGHVLGLIIPVVFFWWINRQIRKRRTRFFFYLDHIIGFVIGAVSGYCAVLGISLFLHTAFQSIVAFDVNSTVTLIYENSYIFKFVSEFNLWGAIVGFFT